MKNEEGSYSIIDIKEADPQLEKHRKDVIEKYIEYEITLCKISKNKINHLMIILNI